MGVFSFGEFIGEFSREVFLPAKIAAVD